MKKTLLLLVLLVANQAFARCPIAHIGMTKMFNYGKSRASNRRLAVLMSSLPTGYYFTDLSLDPEAVYGIDFVSESVFVRNVDRTLFNGSISHIQIYKKVAGLRLYKNQLLLKDTVVDRGEFEVPQGWLSDGSSIELMDAIGHEFNDITSVLPQCNA